MEKIKYIKAKRWNNDWGTENDKKYICWCHHKQGKLLCCLNLSKALYSRLPMINEFVLHSFKSITSPYTKATKPIYKIVAENTSFL